jgi:hypothetical protein
MWVLMIFLSGHIPVFHDFNGQDACHEARVVAMQAQPEAKAYCVPYQRDLLGGNGPEGPGP